MPKDQKVFTKDVKSLEAVQLVQKSGKSQAQIARDLGIANSTLHHWCKEYAKAGEQAFLGSGHPLHQKRSSAAHSLKGKAGSTSGFNKPHQHCIHIRDSSLRRKQAEEELPQAQRAGGRGFFLPKQANHICAYSGDEIVAQYLRQTANGLPVFVRKGVRVFSPLSLLF